MKQGNAGHIVDEIVVHCAAVDPDFMSGAGVEAQRDEIRRWHMANGWRNIGYHFVIGRDGALAEGRPLSEIGAHVRGHNQGTIGICLIGGRTSAADDDFSEHYTEAQELALMRLIIDFELAGVTKVTGHNEYAAKACPGLLVNAWLPSARKRYLGTITPKPVKATMQFQKPPRLLTRLAGWFS